jgi:hypothetical protein
MTRLMARLSALKAVTSETHEEVLTATEQLIDRAIEAHRLALEESRRARAERRKIGSARAAGSRSRK